MSSNFTVFNQKMLLKFFETYNFKIQSGIQTLDSLTSYKSGKKEVIKLHLILVLILIHSMS